MMQQVVLITGNRNQIGPDSLEATLRAYNSTASLPVLTIGNRDRILADRAYARRAAERMLELLSDLEALRGAGRLYIP